VRFCLECGAGEVRRRIPDGDTHTRDVCDACGYVHYVNPKIIAGSIPVWEGRILMCKRAIEPRRGFWTLPAGFLELGETMSEGARREALEEANARVEIGDLYALYSVPHISQVYALFSGSLLDVDFSPGSESSQVVLYREEDVPWGEIAFPAIRKTLELYFEDRRRGRFRTHAGDIIRESGKAHEPLYRIRSI
jgi:ADP-ribose pyrophosphatase YjhB (NUDIX family)